MATISYLCSPYSGSPALTELRMQSVCRKIAELQLAGRFVVTPLLMHFVLPYAPRIEGAGQLMASPRMVPGHYSASGNLNLEVQLPSLGSDWGTWAAYSKELLIRCDDMLVLRLQGWKESVGVQAEIALAGNLCKPVFFIDP